MTLQLSINSAGDLVIVSDKRKHPSTPAQTQQFRITVEALGPSGAVVDSAVMPYTVETVPAQPAYTDPIRVVDDSGATWSAKSDDGTTAVYGRS